MVRIDVTDDVSHRSNHTYRCVLVQFEDRDNHYFHEKANWMPTDDEVVSLVKAMTKNSPSFTRKLMLTLGVI